MVFVVKVKQAEAESDEASGGMMSNGDTDSDEQRGDKKELR